MSKSRSFSIFLLKQGSDASNALKDDHSLKDSFDAAYLPAGATLLVLDNIPHEPWWKDYFGVTKPLSQVTKGALIFLPIETRCFALSFGHVAHNLKDTSYEYDFGLRVTLNSLDPNKLKSTDVLEPGAARRQRTQVPVESDLTYFDFDRDSAILKSLTGKVKAEHADLFKHATGASNLRISSTVGSTGLAGLCTRLLGLYESDAFKTAFPDIQNISPIRDPLVIERLDTQLLTALRVKSADIYLTIPDLVEYRDNVFATFSGAGQSRIYNDVFIDQYYEYLSENGKDITEIGVADLKRHSLRLSDEQGDPRQRYPIYSSLIFDSSLNGGTETYHLCEGNWYRVENGYIAKLRAFLDPHCVDLPLPAYAHKDEGSYNKSVSEAMPGFVCLDKTNISALGQTPVEPCDLLSLVDGHAVFSHVKVSTLSAQLSHLFNQGTNAIELLKLENGAPGRLKALIAERAVGDVAEDFTAPIDDVKFHVVFAIVSHKDKTAKSHNLPLFSRISLMRNMKALQVMSVRAGFGFIEDKSQKPAGKKKRRKRKGTEEDV